MFLKYEKKLGNMSYYTVGLLILENGIGGREGRIAAVGTSAITFCTNSVCQFIEKRPTICPLREREREKRCFIVNKMFTIL